MMGKSCRHALVNRSGNCYSIHGLRKAVPLSAEKMVSARGLHGGRDDSMEATNMKASEGKLGRVFLIRLEEGDRPVETIEAFAAEMGVNAGQVFLVADRAVTGILAPDAGGKPALRIPDGTDGAWRDGEVVVQELLGINFRRVKDPASGRQTLARIASTKTRVMEKPAPEPEEEGPGTIPVYLFNAEFN